MGDFNTFHTNIKARLPENITSNVFEMTSDNLDLILKEAQAHFRLTSEQLKFELLEIQEGKLFANNQYTILAYPTQKYEHTDIGMHMVETEDAEFFIRRGKGKIYLMVTAPSSTGEPVLLDTVLEEMKKHPSLQSFDVERIKGIVESAQGIWEEIMTFKHVEEEDAELFLKIEKNDMSASIKMTAPDLGGAQLTQFEILRELKHQEIRHGIKVDLITQLERKPIYNQWVEVVVGTEPINGEDARVELVQRDGKTHIVKKGSASIIKTVQKGNLIARKILETEGSDGRNIYNEILFAQVGNSITMSGNQNVEISEDNSEAYALSDGSVYIRDAMVYVDELWIIEGDLTTEIGDIDFPGSLIIEGNIFDDFIVKVQGSLTVLGSIGNSNIVVGQNLYIEHGVNGRGHATIEVGGTCVSKFIESVTVKVGKLCLVEESIINAHILSLGKIITLEGKGKVSSSTLIAEEEIIARNIGSELGDASIIKVLSFAEEREKLVLLQGKVQDIKSKITFEKNFLGDNLTPELFKKLPKSQKEQIKIKLINIRKLQRQLKHMYTVIEGIRKKIASSKSSVSISVIREVKLGTEIILNEKRTLLRSDTTNITFKIFEDQISRSPLSSHVKKMDDRFFGQIKQDVKL